MIDLITAEDGKDFGIADTPVPRATNILSVQLGALEYAKNFGIDLRYFLTESFKIQTESFKAYLVQVLANYGINAASVLEVVEALYTNFIFNLSADDSSTGLLE